MFQFICNCRNACISWVIECIHEGDMNDKMVFFNLYLVENKVIDSKCKDLKSLYNH